MVISKIAKINGCGQFAHSTISLSDEEILQAIKSTDRGSYVVYGSLFRRLAGILPIKEMLEKAGSPVFIEGLRERFPTGKISASPG